MWILLFLLYLSSVSISGQACVCIEGFFRQLHGQLKLLDALQSRPAIRGELFQGYHFRPRMPCFDFYARCSKTSVQKAALLTLREWFEGADQKSKHSICKFWFWCNFTAEKAQLFSAPIHETSIFFPWHGHGRHCNWWLRGLILGSWLARPASELAWWLQPDVCFCYLWKANKNLVVSVVKSHDVTCNYSTSLSYIQWCLINCKLKATNVIPWYLAQVLPKRTRPRCASRELNMVTKFDASVFSASWQRASRALTRKLNPNLNPIKVSKTCVNCRSNVIITRCVCMSRVHPLGYLVDLSNLRSHCVQNRSTSCQNGDCSWLMSAQALDCLDLLLDFFSLHPFFA